MEESVKALEGREARRYAEHQIRVDNGYSGECMLAAFEAEADFFLSFFVCYYSPGVGFRARACGCGYGDGRERSVLGTLSLA